MLNILSMAVSLNNNRTHLKLSLSSSLDVGLNIDQAVEEGFKSAISRKSRRKTDTKLESLTTVTLAYVTVFMITILRGTTMVIALITRLKPPTLLLMGFDVLAARNQ